MWTVSPRGRCWIGRSEGGKHCRGIGVGHLVVADMFAPQACVGQHPGEEWRHGRALVHKDTNIAVGRREQQRALEQHECPRARHCAMTCGQWLRRNAGRSTSLRLACVSCTAAGCDISPILVSKNLIMWRGLLWVCCCSSAPSLLQSKSQPRPDACCLGGTFRPFGQSL